MTHGSAVRCLAIETSGLSGSVAALEGDRLLAEHALDPRQRSARSLAPAMRDLLTSVGWRPADVQVVAVGLGPGSFTGLRVGVTTAKTFAYAVGSQIVGANTLDAVARGTPATCPNLSAVLDAQREELFARDFVRNALGAWRPVGETRIVPVDAWLAGLASGWMVSGPGWAKHAVRLPPGVNVAAPEHWQPMAGAIGRLALERHVGGHGDDLWSLVPRYYRPSAAEEKRSRP